MFEGHWLIRLANGPLVWKQTTRFCDGKVLRLLLFIVCLKLILWFQQINVLQKNNNFDLKHSPHLSKKLEARQLNKKSVLSYDYFVDLFKKKTTEVKFVHHDLKET